MNLNKFLAAGFALAGLGVATTLRAQTTVLFGGGNASQTRAWGGWPFTSRSLGAIQGLEDVGQNVNEALLLAQARYKSGISSIIELSHAELNQTSAQIGGADARYDYQIQRSSLDFQLGRLH